MHNLKNLRNNLDTYQKKFKERNIEFDINGFTKLDKINRLRSAFMNLGYDCYMIFVNTSLDVALERNAQRERSVPEFVTTKSWNDCQKNIGQFQRIFGGSNFIVVDNNVSAQELVTKTLNNVSKVVAEYMRRPVQNYTAKKWIARELEIKRRK